MKSKPSVGDKLYVTFNNRRDEPEECEVFKVGRLYFYVKSRNIHESHGGAKFNIKYWNHEYGNRGTFNYHLYKDKEHFETVVRANNMAREIGDAFRYGRSIKMTNEQIFAIADIFNIETKKGDI